VRHLVRKADRVLQGYFNESFFDLEQNGEARVIETLTSCAAPLIALDVGANRGEWTAALLARSHAATVHCFEIIPTIAQALKATFTDRANVSVHAYGLSSRTGDVDVFRNYNFETASSICPRFEDPLFSHAQVAKITCKVHPGDAIIERLPVPKIDLLKIDVEGHEIEVLAGLTSTMQSARRPRVIQFEYGTTWLPTRHNLREAYQMLQPLGYTIGRLFPDGVEFKPYQFEDDHFRPGNYVAVQSEDPLRPQLTNFRRVGSANPKRLCNPKI